MLCQKELDNIIDEEGFESRPYQCTAGVWTIGHGLTYLTENESRYILEYFRLPAVEKALKHRQRWLEAAHPEVQRVLINMAYQLGIEGVSRFHKMIDALVNHDYPRAADEMLDSKWAKQTPARAKRLSDRIRAL